MTTTTATASGQWFDIDKAGLGKLMASRGPGFMVHELVQNAWDEAERFVEIEIYAVSRGPDDAEISANAEHEIVIRVKDDCPDGFKDLSHAYTLFAESAKKGDVTKRGRFNLGEKLVLALANQARIVTTTGCVIFDEDGRREEDEPRTRTGSTVEVVVPGDELVLGLLVQAAGQLIQPDGITTTLNGVLLAERELATSYEITLDTLKDRGDGVMKGCERKGTVNLLKPLDGEKPMIYEMGIPVVEADGGDPWHYDVQQKVPLNMDRDNVKPSYLRTLRVGAYNAAYGLVEGQEENTATWVKDATADKRANPEAVRHMVEQRHGIDAVTADPSDREAERIAASQGRPVIHGGTYSGKQWENIRKSGAMQPAGQVTPSPKPYDADGKLLETVPVEDMTGAERAWVGWAERLGRKMLGRKVKATLVDEPGWPFMGTYGPGKLTINRSSFGHGFASPTGEASESYLDFLIHEFSHEYGKHMTEEFDGALSRLGAATVRLALEHPGFFTVSDK